MRACRNVLKCISVVQGLLWLVCNICFIPFMFANENEGKMSNEYIISLAGEWKYKLDPENKGIREKWFEGNRFENMILLPGTTDENHIGKEEERQTGRFTRIYTYRGAVWYNTEFNIPQEWKGKRILFSMERTKVSKVWVDGRFVGEDNSLITTQRFILSESAVPGKHILTVRIHNGNEEQPPVGGNHQTSDGTQTNWNGILGKILLQATHSTWIDNVQVYPDVEQRKAIVKIELGCRDKSAFVGKVTLNAHSWNGEKIHTLPTFTKEVASINDKDIVTCELAMGKEAQLWSEFNPVLYHLKAEIEGTNNGESCKDIKEMDFGMRCFHTVGTSFAINGQKTFLRGKHDAAVFPHTGYPPMEVDEWMKILSTIKSYGINHIRCHTWCPPQAAFLACDRLGIYMLPELPHWGAVGKKPKALDGDVEQKTEFFSDTDQYLLKEGYRLLDEFGNHASFTMFEIGNELGGNRFEIARMIDLFRKHDARHLYTGGANCFLWAPQQQPGEDYWTTTITGGSYGAGVYKNTRGMEVRSSYPSHKEGHVNNILRGTDYDYSPGIAHVTIPVISHENGQYQMYPNYNQIEKFTGVTRAYNLEIYRDRLAKAGMADLADDFFKASGALAVLCYREDIESAIRTRGFGGFQLLDLQDFPGQGTALVGILDSYLDSKGLITPEKFREFCCEVVPLLRHESFVWTSDQTFYTQAVVANYGARDLSVPVQWYVKDRTGKEIAAGKLPLKKIVRGDLTHLGVISVDLSKVNIPQKLEVTISIPGTVYKNSYSIWVYPANIKPKPAKEVKVFNSLTPEAKKVLHKGGKVLILPDKETLPTSIDGAFQTDFWCYSMFRKYSPPGTLGIFCNPDHPALAHFPTEFHSNWQWWRLLKQGRPIDLATLPANYRPIVQVIDNVTTNRKLGILLEAKVGKGSLLVCSMNLPHLQDYPEARQMYYSLLKYMESDNFNPTSILQMEEIESIIHD